MVTSFRKDDDLLAKAQPIKRISKRPVTPLLQAQNPALANQLMELARKINSAIGKQLQQTEHVELSYLARVMYLAIVEALAHGFLLGLTNKEDA